MGLEIIIPDCGLMHGSRPRVIMLKKTRLLPLKDLNNSIIIIMKLTVLVRNCTPD